jgi:CBS domain-containing protein
MLARVDMEAARLMTLDVTCVDEDTPIAMAWDLMQKLHVHHLPVLDQGKLAGMITDRALLLRAQKRLDGGLVFPDLCAAEVMTFKPVACCPEAGVDELAAIMTEHRVDAVPICTRAGQLVGLVTAYDLLRLLATRAEVMPRPYCDRAQGGWQNLA